MCYFCQRNINDVDWKNVRLLSNFISASCKIKSRKKTRTCASHQRKLSQAIKRARFMALMPFSR